MTNQTSPTETKRDGLWPNWIREEKRLAIYLRDGLACAYCGASVESGVVFTLDHLTPHSKGGSNHESNLVTACNRCNASRGTRSVRSFCKAVAAYLNHGVTADSIERHVRNCSKRVLDMNEAKTMVARRGSAAKVLAEFSVPSVESADPRGGAGTEI